MRLNIRYLHKWTLYIYTRYHTLDIYKGYLHTRYLYKWTGPERVRMKQFPCTALAACLLVARVASMCSDEQQEAATNNFKVRQYI